MISGFFYNFISLAANLILPLVYMPYVYRLFGPTINGNIAWISSIAQYFSLFASMSLSPFAVRKLASLRDDELGFKVAAREFLAFGICNSLLWFCIFMFFSLAVAPEQFVEFVLVGLGILAMGMNVDYIYQAEERFKILALRNIAIKIILVVFVFLFVRRKEDVIAYLLINSVAQIAVNYTLILGSGVGISFRGVIGVLIKMYGELRLFFLMNLAMSFYSRIHMVILGFVAPKIESGLYSFSERFMQLALSGVQLILTTMSPGIVYSYKTDPERYKRDVEFGLRVNLLIVSIVWSVFFGCSQGIQQVFGGEKYYASVAILRVFSFMLIISGISGYIATLQMLVQKKEGEMLLIALLASSISIIANFSLSPKHGAFGAVVAYLLAEFIIMVTMIYKSSKNAYPINWPLSFIIKNCLLPGVFSALVGWYVPGEGALWALFGKAGLCIVVWVMVFGVSKYKVVNSAIASGLDVKGVVKQVLKN